MLAVAIAAILLVLHASKPPQIILPPDAGQQADEKIRQFQNTIHKDTQGRLELDQPELNAWLSDNLAVKKPARAATAAHSLDGMPAEQAQSPIRDVKIELLEDSLRVYTIFDMHGIDLSLELEGRLLTQDGYIRLEPTAGKLGSLPLMSGAMRAVTDRLFNSPENKEKFKLPSEIRDIRIEHGNLVVTSR
jgi:hypothetical protein